MEQGNMLHMLHKMAEYDFSTPINVTMIFEDSDDDTKFIIDESNSSSTETDTINHESQNFNIERNSNIIVKENTRTKEDNSNVVVVNNNSLQPISQESRKRKMKDPEVVYSVDAIVRQYEKFNHAHQQKCSEMDRYSNHNFIQGNNSEKPTYTSQQINQSKQNSNDVNSALVTLSENLIVMMDSYYQMQTQTRSIKDETIRKKSQDAFLYIRRYFLDLSYDILDALILPQENNTVFVNSFLDNTIEIAVRKKGIKCDRRHVYTFYKYMLQWAKLQKERTNRLQQQNPTYNNILLKQYLSKPPIQSSIPANSNTPNGNNCTDNSCIFSSGPPGREITISVNPGAVNNGNTRNAFQPPSCKSMRTVNESGKTFIPVNRTPVTHTNTNVQSVNYNQRPREAVYANHYQTRSDNVSQNVYHPPVQQNYYHNSNYYPQTMATQLPTQIQVNRTRSTESCESGYVSPCYGSPNVNPMDGGRSEEQAVLAPVITNIVSLNPRVQYISTHGCHMCGKTTEYICSACYTYYCSTFCQQLDSQFHKVVCRRT